MGDIKEVTFDLGNNMTHPLEDHPVVTESEATPTKTLRRREDVSPKNTKI